MYNQSQVTGFTAWANVRLLASDHQVTNVLKDLFIGTHLKALLESFTGKSLRRMQSMDGLTLQQVITRVEWFVEELKKAKIISENDNINCRAIARRNYECVLNLLWKLIAHDIWFTWERSSQLQLSDDKLLCSIPFKWTPEAPPTSKKTDPPSGSTLALFADLEALSSPINGSGVSPTSEPCPQPEVEPFPGRDLAKAYNSKIPIRGWEFYPSPDQCILEMVNSHLQMSAKGKNLLAKSLDNLVDGHILCCLANSFLPGTFTTEVLLNDRWSANLALKTMEKLLYASSSFTSDDLYQGDSTAVCAYMCSIFMAGYKYKQCRAVAQSVKKLQIQIAAIRSNLRVFPSEILELNQFQQKSELQQRQTELQKELGRLCTSYDVKSCQKWMVHAEKVQKKTWKYIRQKMKGRFETVTVPRNITITGLCLSLLIDLSLTRGGGFYLAQEKETVARNRRIILQNKETGEYIDDFSGFQPHVSVRKILSLSATDVIEPRVYQKYKIFLESDSKNKILKKNSTFLYQVFPGSASHWQQLVFKALRSRDYTAVKDMVLFFRTTHNEVINTEDPSTGNTALHLACRSGHFETALLLLENGASLNVRNKNGRTPCFFAAAGQHRSVCQLLIEWGCDFHAKDSRGQGPLDSIHSERLKEYLLGYSAFWSSAVPAIMHGGADVLYEIVQKHLQDVAGMASLRSRCINGSTLLHTAAYFGETDIIKTLLGLQVDVNLLDYKGATALHRARDSETMQFLIDHGADVNQKDDDGNTPVHMVCYGEQGKDTRLDCLRLLLSYHATTVKANRKGLLAIHCAAMQGRIDVIELLLQCDSDGQMQRKIQRATETNSPSLLYLAVANDHLKCAEWLAMRSFTFKPTEQEELLYGLFQQEIARKEKTKTLEFLIKSGVSVNTVYAGGDSTLHLAALQTNLTELLALLLGQGADVNKLNDEQCSPLFYAVHVSNFHGAALLLENGAGVMLRDSQGLTAFDYIRSYDEWIESGLFSEEITTLLKAYDLKQTRSLIRGITRKLNVLDARKQLLNSSAWFNLESSHVAACWVKSQPRILLSKSVMLQERPDMNLTSDCNRQHRTGNIMFPKII
ncbi:hypothetical protein HHUSO_G15403 [Huso huso]|uniref:Calponin-homology (CH) domain-containing protein n=1 Tax=Huso huso TaxID=61971 RepID=A0ABR0ZC67_HUSHU